MQKNEYLEYDDVDARVASFLGDLERICDKHGISDIWGCGCCGSPCIKVEEPDHTYESLERDESGVCSVHRSAEPIMSDGKIIGWRGGYDITKDGKREHNLG